VTGERERQLAGDDAMAVVAHADQSYAAVLDVHSDLSGAGVERVLDQFLDHGGGPLDDLARGDLVDERAFEDPDRHGGWGLASRRHGRRASVGDRAGLP
jgi:hypothetical protein